MESGEDAQGVLFKYIRSVAFALVDQVCSNSKLDADFAKQAIMRKHPEVLTPVDDSR